MNGKKSASTANAMNDDDDGCDDEIQYFIGVFASIASQLLTKYYSHWSYLESFSLAHLWRRRWQRHQRLHDLLVALWSCFVLSLRLYIYSVSVSILWCSVWCVCVFFALDMMFFNVFRSFFRCLFAQCVCAVI